jgi:transposase
MARDILHQALGIDVSKDELVIYDTATHKTLHINNSSEGILQTIIGQSWKPEVYLVGFESTGDYGLLTQKLFSEAGFTVSQLNPIETHNAIKKTVRGTKTDSLDAQKIAELILAGKGRTVGAVTITRKKVAARVDQKFAHVIGDFKRILGSLKKKTKDADIDTVKLQSAVEHTINDLEEQRARVEKELFKRESDDPLTRQEQIIDSHIGCGTRLSAIISAEAGDIKRFTDPAQLVAYAGIDPRVKQSGDSDYHGKITKRGNSNLRHALFLAANVARTYDPQLKDYYERKIKEGKHHLVATVAVARKMCERIYATVTQDRFYEKREVVPAIVETIAR